MLEVLSAVTGESIASFEFAEAKVMAVKRRLARKIGIQRFRLRLLQDNCPLDDSQALIDDKTFTHQVVQLVIQGFQQPDTEQDKSLMRACEENDDKLLEQHLNRPQNPNFLFPLLHGNVVTSAALPAAAYNGSLQCTTLLIEAGANKDQGTDTGATPLFIAAARGHLDVVQFLVESGANKDKARTHDGATPLFMAALIGHLEVVRLLVESGANKDQGKTDDGATPLFIAAENGHLEVVRLLVESGANKDQGRTDNGATPLFIAAARGHLEVVRLLVESGANKDQGRTDNGATPLFIAAENGHLEVVRLLVESGANKDQGRTDNGATPLQAAGQNDHLEIVGFLAESVANKRPRHWMTPLFIAAHEGHLEVAPCLGSFSSQETERWRLADKQIFANQSILFDMDNLRGNCKGKSIALSMFFQNHRWMYGLSTLLSTMQLQAPARPGGLLDAMRQRGIFVGDVCERIAMWTWGIFQRDEWSIGTLGLLSRPYHHYSTYYCIMYSRGNVELQSLSFGYNGNFTAKMMS